MDSFADRLLIEFDRALRTVAGVHEAHRPSPAQGVGEPELGDDERAYAAALMRVNHVGEVCAQALYRGQAIAARDPRTRAALRAAAREEGDHLAWTAGRVRELDGRLSLLNPLWYAGAFGIGLAAGLAGDRRSLGFVAETERQVEAHLSGHLDSLPAADMKSRAIVAAMRADEARHGAEARALGSDEPPAPVRCLMRAAARVMTTIAHRF